jgi:mono/diheme cytochrome c family protein
MVRLRTFDMALALSLVAAACVSAGAVEQDAGALDGLSVRSPLRAATTDSSPAGESDDEGESGEASELDESSDDDGDAGVVASGEDDASGGEVNEVEETPAEPATFTRVYSLLRGWCVACHGSGRQLDLSSRETAYAQLVGVPAQYSACASTGTLRVAPGSADDSLLIHKLENVQACGTPMPPSGESLIQQDHSLMLEIRSWIDAGALDD